MRLRTPCAQHSGFESACTAGPGRRRVRHTVLVVVLGLAVVLAVAAASSAATFTVTQPFGDTDDGWHDVNPGDGVCANPLGDCAIHAAVDEANAHPGVDTIAFDLASAEQVTIFETLEITEAVVIDGTTEPDFAGCDSPSVVFRYWGDPDEPGFHVTAGGSTFRGSYFRDWGAAGVVLRLESDGNVIECNRFSTGDSNFGVQRGIAILGADNTVRGNEFDWANHGVIISGLSATGNVVAGNVMTINATGVAISGGASDNTIGGVAPGDGNTIKGAEFQGVDWSVGVEVDGGTGNAILGNSIHAGATPPSDDQLAIDLVESPSVHGVTPNDPLDADAGPNGLQNFPELASAEVAGGETHVTGVLSSAPSTTYRVELFASDACDEGLGHGPGETFLEATSVTTDGSGEAAIDVDLPATTAGFVITATATDPDGNTSEFSACREVIVGAPPDPDADDDGIEDGIDVGDGAFDDGAGTTGAILDTAGHEVVVAADPDGVRVTVTGNGTAKAKLLVCGITVQLAPGSEVVLACGSLTATVVTATIPVELLLAGGVVVSVPSGVAAFVDELSGGGVAVEHLSGDVPITVSVDGTPVEIAPGAPPASYLGCQGAPPPGAIVGANGNDRLRGTSGDDVIWALGGNDLIDGRGGNDTICAGDGLDLVDAGAGDDVVSGGNGADAVTGGKGADTVSGGSGIDALDGGPGDDAIAGGDHPDAIAGGPDNDQLDGGAGFDIVFGGAGTDVCAAAEIRGGCEG